MPVRARRVCRGRGCGDVTANASGYCDRCESAGRNESVLARSRKQTDPFYLSPAWRKFRRWWIMRNPVCARCDRPAEMVDHIIPISAGGAKLDVGNVQSLCWRCHASKTGVERSARRGGSNLHRL